MQPFFNEMNTKGIQPYLAGTISQDQALESTLAPLRKFMFSQTRDSDLTYYLYFFV
jgi:flagellar biosynthetic protein FliP